MSDNQPQQQPQEFPMHPLLCDNTNSIVGVNLADSRPEETFHLMSDNQPQQEEEEEFLSWASDVNLNNGWFGQSEHLDYYHQQQTPLEFLEWYDPSSLL